jgi:sugar transferase (PEP-CTERM/EpsH1 system associated)
MSGRGLLAGERTGWTKPRTASTRPRIVHVIPTLRVAGLEGVVLRLTTGLGQTLDHAVMTPSGNGPLRARFSEQIPVIAMAERHRPDRWNAFRMAAVFRELRPDIVHSRNWTCLDAIIGARLARVPVVVHGEHGREAADPEGRNPLRRRVRRLLAPLVTQFVTVSRDLERWLIEDVRVPARKVTVICNGVDTRRFQAHDRTTARRGLGLPESCVAIGSVGRLDPVKDHAGLIEAFARVSSDPRAILLIVGEGPFRGELERLIEARGLAGRVRLLGERHDVPQVLAALDVFVLSSLGEGIANAILEAMATGLPVIATRVGGNPELVVDGSTGMLVPSRSPEALAAALRRYLEEPALAAAHGCSGRARAVSEFALERMVAAYGDLYARLLGARRAE